MKKTITIIRLELNNLFCSPIPWFLMLVLLFTTEQSYIKMLKHPIDMQEMGGKILNYITFLTAQIYSGQIFGVFPSVLYRLYLYIPLLTMGLISRETSSGTIKLLYSSPIKVWQIVVGKFLAMAVFSLLLVGLIGITVIAGCVNINSPDVGLMLSGLLGCFLLLCAYAAIGIFMSSLTSYQVMAALATLVLLSALSTVRNLWQDVDFVRDLTYFLSIDGRTNHMVRGLIITKDVFYFLLIITMFISFTVCKLNGERETRRPLVKTMRYVLISVSVLALGYLTSRPVFTGYLDVTATQTETLTKASQQVLNRMKDDELEVTSYINLLDRYWSRGTPSDRNDDAQRWEPYVRFLPKIKFKYIYYYDKSNIDISKYIPGKSMLQYAKELAKFSKVDFSIFKTPAEIRKIIDLRPEQNRYVMQLKYKGRSTFLRLFDDGQVFPKEEEITAALKRLSMPRVPKIAFVTGELERNIDQLGDKQYKILTNSITFRNSMINQGFDVESVSLKTQEIPGDIAALVIADPKIPFDEPSKAKIQQYISKGGNILLAGEPGKQNILNPVLQQIGVQMGDGMLVEKSNEFAPDLIRPYLTPTGVGIYKQLESAARDSLCITMPGAVTLSYKNSFGFLVKPLLMTDARYTWNKIKAVNLDMVSNETAPSGVAGNAIVNSQQVPNASAVMPVKTVTGGIQTSGNMVSGGNSRAVTNVPGQQIFTGSPTAFVDTVMKRMKEARDKLAHLHPEMAEKLYADTVEKDAKTRVLVLQRISMAQKQAQGVVTPPIVQSAPQQNSFSKPVGQPITATQTALPVQLAFSATDGDTRGTLPTALSLIRKINGKEQRIIVTGDADFLSNAELSRNNVAAANFFFATGVFGWFSYGEYPIDTSRPKGKDTRIQLTDKSYAILQVALQYVLPGLLLILGSVFLIRRRRK